MKSFMEKSMKSMQERYINIYIYNMGIKKIYDWIYVVGYFVCVPTGDKTTMKMRFFLASSSSLSL